MSNRSLPHLRARAVSRVLWCARWLLVLLLVWDQVGSPLHHHRHDSGVDAQWIGAFGHGDATLHLEERDDDASFAHAVLAVRTQSERQLGAATEAGPDLDMLVDADAPERQVSAMRCSVTPIAQAPRCTYRSLPPAGRAPPQQA